MVKRAFGTALLITICVVAFALTAQYFEGDKAHDERASEELLLQSLQAAANECYIVEGAYPPSLEYLCENYGVVIDESRFAVFYNVTEEHLMPEITVLPIGG